MIHKKTLNKSAILKVVKKLLQIDHSVQKNVYEFYDVIYVNSIETHA